MFEMFFILLCSHSIADFALQNDYIAQAKNRNSELGKDVWFMVLPAHGFIHAGLVYFVTMNIYASIFQFITHVIIDFVKCENKIGYKTDQALHVFIMLLIAIFI